jgi:hypothetical protein
VFDLRSLKNEKNALPSSDWFAFHLAARVVLDSVAEGVECVLPVLPRQAARKAAGDAAAQRVRAGSVAQVRLLFHGALLLGIQQEKMWCDQRREREKIEVRAWCLTNHRIQKLIWSKSITNERGEHVSPRSFTHLELVRAVL